VLHQSYIGVIVALQWCYSCVKVVSPWYPPGSEVALACVCYSDVTVFSDNCCGGTVVLQLRYPSCHSGVTMV
jgi:hypothetical protein